MQKINVIWDMETGGPDDFFTLLLLIGHPRVNLKAITITPGSPDQVGFIRKVLKQFDLNIPVGSFNINHQKECVSKWYYNVYGNINPSLDAKDGADVIYNNCDYNTTIITGGPLKNLGNLIRKYPDFNVGRVVAQGGFAGSGVVPDDLQLEKFKGLTTCPTYNFNGSPKDALEVLNTKQIDIKRFVSKNVCHGVFYDYDLHKKVGEIKDEFKYLKMIYNGMDKYLSKHPNGKKFHDPLTACSAIDESIIEWREVEIFRSNGKWGSRLCDGSGIWISINYNREKFEKILLEHEKTD